MKKNTKNIVNAALFALIPLAACVIYAALQGVMLWEIEPLASILNDELFYYKQIEGMIKYKNPLGFFGYNGSYADVGTLGAWPVSLLMPYVFMGKIFGISPYKMIAFNITFVMVAFFVFYMLAKPKMNQIVFISVLFLIFPPSVRYMLSGMTEPLFFSGIIIIVGFSFYFENKVDFSIISILVCYVFIIYMALCRPWMLIFIIVPFAHQIKKSPLKAIILAAGSFLIFAIIYVVFIMPRCAAYYEQTINYGVFDVLANNGIIAFIKEIFYCLINGFWDLWNNNILKNGRAHVTVLFTLAIMCLWIVVNTVFHLSQKRKFNDSRILYGIISICVVLAVVFAILIFYRAEQTSRHTISLVVCLQFIIGMKYCTKNKIVSVFLIIVLFAIGCSYKLNIYAWQLPTNNDEFNCLPIKKEAEQLQNFMQLTKTDSGWNNTVAMILNNKITNYGYYIPSGMGINLYIGDSALYDRESKLPKYLIVHNEIDNNKRYEDIGYKQVSNQTDIVVYIQEK